MKINGGNLKAMCVSDKQRYIQPHYTLINTAFSSLFFPNIPVLQLARLNIRYRTKRKNNRI